MAAALLCTVSCLQNSDDVAGGIGHEGEARTIAGVVHYPESYPGPVNKAAIFKSARNFLATVSSLPEHAVPDSYTDSAGKFNVTVTDTGEYFLEVNDGKNNAVRIPCTVLDTGAVIHLRPDTLRPTGAVRGTVSLSTLPDTPVFVQVYGSRRIAAVDKKSRTFLIGDLPAGAYTLRAVAPTSRDTLTRETTITVASMDTALADPLHLIGFVDERYSKWPYSRRLSIDTLLHGARVNEPCVNFPVLVRLRDYNFPFKQTGVGGEDIRFANARGAPLRYEIEEWDTALSTHPYWDSSFMQAAVWVTLDTLHAGRDSQYITLYWGEAGAVDWSSPKDAFSTANGFSGVWHMNKLFPSIGGARQTTPNAVSSALDAQVHIVPSDTTIIEGYLGRSMEFDGVDDYLTITGMVPVASTTLTIEAWIRLWQPPDSLVPARDGVIISQKGAFTISVTRDSMVKAVFHKATGTADSVSLATAPGPAPYFLRHFHHMAFVCTGTEILCYIDGQKTGSVPQTIAAGLNGNDLYIGAAETANGPARFFPGTIDEVRIQPTARSAGWINASFNNQRDNRLHKIGEIN